MALRGKCRTAMALVTAVATMAVLGISTAHATNQGITGQKLLLKSGKFVLLSKDPSISIAGSDAVGGADSSITFNDGSGPVTLALPKTLWTANGGGTLFKYTNPDAPSGPSVVKAVKIAGGMLKAGGKGAPIAVPNGAASINVVLSLDGSTNTYCMTFSGTGDGSKFLVKDAAAGTCPGSGAVCGNNIREGSEVCDGTDATACPGNCQANCTCPPVTCPASGGDATACLKFNIAAGACNACVNTNEPPGDFFCLLAAVGDLCLTANANDFCSADVNTIGCAAACCSPPACGNNMKEGSEQCDGTDAIACPGICQANCTCPAQMCGNNVREGTEVCDGSDAAACPGTCKLDCTCPISCPATGGDATACLAFNIAAGACQACMDAKESPRDFLCSNAAASSCANGSFNDSCSADVNAKGCSAQCCPLAVCGNNIKEGTETCDRSDATVCQGNCQANCTCPGQTCGNNVREGTEACDGSDATACPGNCLANCTCLAQRCGNNVREGTEACDGSDAPHCPGQCLFDCTCGPQICGDHIREGTEECDDTDSVACADVCTPSCTCPTGMCPTDDVTLCSHLSSPSCGSCCSNNVDCFLACMGGCSSSCADAIRGVCASACCP